MQFLSQNGKAKVMKSLKSDVEEVADENELAEGVDQERLGQLDALQEGPQIGMDQLMQQIAAVADVIFIAEEVTPEVAQRVCNHLILINERNMITGVFDPICLVINSPGGCLNSGWMICDMMDMIQTPVHTYGLGLIASAGLLIFMNGDYESRMATKNSQFMSHRYSMVMGGTHTSLEAQKTEITRLHKRIVEHYAKNTALSVKEIEDQLLPEHDVWLSATECKKLNIVDRIIPVKKQHLRDIRKKEEADARRAAKKTAAKASSKDTDDKPKAKRKPRKAKAS